jgi:macrolide transport system ATP-binding/permease protein
MELIRLENITKTYYLGEVDVPVLKGVSLSIARGEMVALMGASGSGKTTLMNLLGCLDRPTSGQYWLDGQEMSQLTPNQRALVRTDKLGFVFQSFNLLPRTTALANVVMPLDYAPHRPSRADANQFAETLLERVGLADRMDHESSQMSGGQQQRVAIARSLVNRPALVLADEPTGNLDSHTSVEILRMFQRLNAEGITVILVTHDPSVAAFAHRTIRIVDGLIAGDEVRAPEGDRPPADGPSGGDATAEASGPLAAAPAGSGATAEAVRVAAAPAVAGGNGEAAATAVLADPATSGQPAAAGALAAHEPAAAKARRSHAFSLFPPTFRTAMGALRRNKMRSALTALGVIIGVGAVIAMTEIGQGSKVAMQKSIASMGANILLVQSGAATSGGVSFGSGSVLTLTPQDADEIVKQCPAVSDDAPQVGARTQIIYGNRNWVPNNITGSTLAFLRIRDWQEMDEGEPFSDRDVKNAAAVCLVGQTIKRELFQGESPIGKEIRLQNVGFKVIGVLSAKGANMMGTDQDDIVLAPWTTIKFRVSGTQLTNTNQSAAAGTTAVNTLDTLYPNDTTIYPALSTTEASDTPQPIRFVNVNTILAQAASTDQIPEAIQQITDLLHERHRIRPGQDDDFNIRNMTEITDKMSQLSRLMEVLLIVVAGISLVVGGVGIMNIMLVSVTERTREIGLRMAVGARSHHILRQFLVEAVVLCLLGGAIGIALGRVASVIVRYFTNWTTQTSIPAIIVAVAVSASVGIIFGFYPAWKASRLDPIEALRYE